MLDNKVASFNAGYNHGLSGKCNEFGAFEEWMDLDSYRDGYQSGLKDNPSCYDPFEYRPADYYCPPGCTCFCCTPEPEYIVR